MISLFPKIGRRMDGEVCMPTPPETGVLSQHGSPNYWVELHKRIRSGLIFLQEAKVLPEKDLTESYVNQMKYEVRFLIAYYYSLMIELYGAIPFTPGVLVAVDAPESEMMTPQRPYAEVVDWIDKELLEVSEHLPAVYPIIIPIGAGPPLSWLWQYVPKNTVICRKSVVQWQSRTSRTGRTQKENSFLMPKPNRKDGKRLPKLIST